MEQSCVPSTTKFSIPSFTIKSDLVSGGFVIPKLGSSDKSKDGSKNPFSIPKLFADKNQSNNVPLNQMRNLKIIDVKPSPDNEPLPKFVIDLKSTLLSSTEQKKISPAANVIKKIEVFTPKFIDCENMKNINDISMKELKLDDFCEQLLLSGLTLRFKEIHMKKFSTIGRIIGRKFKKSMPYIKHGFEPKKVVQRFSFATPSPDDLILKHLNKK